jgi:hypothetical protein
MARRTRQSAWSTRSGRILSGPWQPRRVVPAVAAVLAGAVLLLAVLRDSDVPAVAPTDLSSATQAQAAPAEPPSEVLAPAAQQAPGVQGRGVPDPAAPPRTEDEVASFVEAEDTKRRKNPEGFLAEGWTPVEGVPPPEPAVLQLDPGLLATRERDLRVQLETNALAEAQLENAAVIAAQAAEPRTRFAAIQALGRSRSPEAQEQLMQLFDQLPADADRRMIAGYLRPSSVEDPAVAWISGKLTAADVPYDLKKQMTFSLVLAALVESKENHRQDLPRLLGRVPSEWRSEVLDTYRTLTRQPE